MADVFTFSSLPAPNQIAAGGRGRKVLVADDNPDAADSLRELIELFGHSVEVARSGPEAVARAHAFRPDVVLCDIGLPGMDGYGVAHELRRDPAAAAALLVAFTGYAAPEDQRRAREAGFDEHLDKPPDIGRLRQLIERGPVR